MLDEDAVRRLAKDENLIDKASIAQFPCIRNCCLNDDDICLGCYRTLAEITQWGEADDQERIIILKNADQRRENCNNRR
jgi:predicted Fe-S protein YdhL (DUF1289 family)